MSYDSSLKAKWDYENVMSYAISEAREKGFQQGLELAMEKGFAQGFEKGVEQAKSISVRNLLTNTDLSISKIASSAEVSEEAVLKIKDQLKI
jgi:flagellar biosynthesis/type III secretory pathway protein FliH